MNDVERRQVIQRETIKFLAEQQARRSRKSQKSKKSKKTKERFASKPSEKLVSKPTVSKKTKKKETVPKNIEEPKLIQNFCKPGDTVDGRFRVIGKVCDGGFGQIYKVNDEQTKLNIALKVEDISQSTSDNLESNVLKTCQGHDHFAKYYACGKTSTFTFIAMQLLGKNITELRYMCSMKPQRFSVSASVRIAMQCLEAVETLHENGYLHRDVKPSNFAIGGSSEDRHVVYMFDFGLCRNYLTRDRKVKPARSNIGFRGTVRYASLNAHSGQDLARRDDIISWFYSFYELTTGQLPWRKTNQRDVVSKFKSKYTPLVLSQSLPHGSKDIAQHVEVLSYEERPSYSYLSDRLHEVLVGINGKFEDVYDWQIRDCKSLHHWVTSNTV